MNKYKDVPIPSQLQPSFDEREGYWWKRGVSDCRQVMHSDLEVPIREVLGAVDLLAGTEVGNAALERAIEHLQGFLANDQ